MASPRVFITGGNTGIGFESAKALCQKGYDVTIGCRDDVRAANAVRAIKEGQADAKVESIRLDLADLSSIVECYKNLSKQNKLVFDVLLNNAGVMACPKMTTKDGFEYQLGTNHLGHFALTSLLLPHFKKANKPIRIINVSSKGHAFGKMDFNDLFRDKPGAYGALEAYGQSKRANILFTYELARRLETEGQTQITVNALHPGVITTELGRHIIGGRWYMDWLLKAASYIFWFKTPAQGAETQLYLATSPDVANITGKYFDNCKEVKSDGPSYDKETAKKLWEVSEQLVMPKLKAFL
mmetsp:Transcript_23022/g.63583  ORF Transcript_23022/g.63583 Transcript_23022/m.63583 type:complete len:297 (-) Transcript_23022:356-1246(-)|eukprot:CAMPEP_0202351124 /NCGR_PEP_ID=MMETSP1126-20121109/7908_1 /ASSEMBLY_ACC=CAM_ASM_000457 /TAXON_ID=3047 /ORGANISM="Dunaliella tertiolecta, Strain CCMP1320" /LENGTH=296 /DNA_ID=CAMNT_0048943205 /DNA_START=59 /DNA_END=949 /DNA_ORIENTATION=+